MVGETSFDLTLDDGKDINRDPSLTESLSSDNNISGRLDLLVLIPQVLPLFFHENLLSSTLILRTSKLSEADARFYEKHRPVAEIWDDQDSKYRCKFERQICWLIMLMRRLFP